MFEATVGYKTKERGAVELGIFKAPKQASNNSAIDLILLPLDLTFLKV